MRFLSVFILPCSKANGRDLCARVEGELSSIIGHSRGSRELPRELRQSGCCSACAKRLSCRGEHFELQLGPRDGGVKELLR
jgi:hypothetical protein